MPLRPILAALACASLLVPVLASASEQDVARWRPPDRDRVFAFSLPGVRNAHLLPRGEVMLGYHYDRETRDGLRTVDEEVSNASQLQPAGPFTRVPDALEIEKHDFELMLGVHERISLRAALALVETQLRSESVDAGFVRSSSSDSVSAPGDLELAVLVAFMQHGSQRVHFDVGVSAPTGAIHESAGGERLPYLQQTGSGTWDLRSGVTYRASRNAWGWGGQVATVFRFGENELDYRLGDEYRLSAWVMREWARWVGTSLRAAVERWGTVVGSDPGLPAPHASPADAPGLQGRRRVTIAPGLQLQFPGFPGLMLALEAEVPVYQSLDGPQLEKDWSVRTGWRWAF